MKVKALVVKKRKKTSRKGKKVGRVGGISFWDCFVSPASLDHTHSGERAGERSRREKQEMCIACVYLCICIVRTGVFVCGFYLHICFHTFAAQNLSLHTQSLLLSLSTEARWHIPGPSASLYSSAVCQWIHWQ